MQSWGIANVMHYTIKRISCMIHTFLIHLVYTNKLEIN